MCGLAACTKKYDKIYEKQIKIEKHYRNKLILSMLLKD